MEISLVVAFRIYVVAFMLSNSNKLHAWGNSCKFDDGRCIYQIELAQNCDNRQFITNPVQNDYNAKMNEIEKDLGDVRIDHSRRITDLENKLSVLFRKEDDILLPLPVLPDVGSGTTYDSRMPGRPNPGHVATREDNNEDFLLLELQKEFAGLRKDLANTRRRLAETQKTLDRTRQVLNKTQAELSRTAKKLLEKEDKLQKSRRENAKLRKINQSKERALNVTRTKLHRKTEDLKHTRLELWSMRSERDDLQKQLDQCRIELDTARKFLERALVKYHQLNLRHQNATDELVTQQEELTQCYRGKTSQYCGFEDEDMCGFEQVNGTDQLDWVRWNGATPSSWTGPEADHTCGNENGYYMYVETSAKALGDSARLVTPRYQGAGVQCVEFYYNMFGINVGTVNVFTLVPWQDVVPLWRAFGNQGNYWTQARIPIPAREARKGYQVVFEVILELGNQGDVAIDDFRVFDGPCYVAPPASEPVTGSNSTTNGTDISKPVQDESGHTGDGAA